MPFSQYININRLVAYFHQNVNVTSQSGLKEERRICKNGFLERYKNPADPAIVVDGSGKQCKHLIEQKLLQKIMSHILRVYASNTDSRYENVYSVQVNHRSEDFSRSRFPATNEFRSPCINCPTN